MRTIIFKMAIIVILLILLLTIVIFYISSGVVKGDRLLSLYKTDEEDFDHRVPKDVLRIVTYNCGYFSGMKNNTTEIYDKRFIENNIEKFLKVIKTEFPDIIAMQEIDFNSSRSFGIDQAQKISKLLEIPNYSIAVNWNKKYVPFPYWPPSAHFGRILSGQAVFSKFPIISQKRIVLGKPPNGFLYNLFYLDRLIQVTEIEMSGRRVILMNLHLEAFDTATREHQAGKLIELLKGPYKGRPMIILGDFNTVPLHAGKKNGFSDEPDTDYHGDKTMEILGSAGFLESVFPIDDTYRRINATFPSIQPDRKLDYIFYTKEYFELINKKIINIDSSDHLPVIAELRLKND